MRKRTRAYLFLYVILLFCLSIIFFCNALLIDRILVILMMATMFHFLFIFCLEKERLQEDVYDDQSDVFRRICIFYTIGLLADTIGMVIPFQLNLILFMTVLISLITSKLGGVIMSLLWSLLLFGTGSLSGYGLCISIIYIITAALLFDYLCDYKYRLYSGFITLAVCFSMPAFTTVLEKNKITVNVVVTGIVGGVITFFLLMVFVPPVLKSVTNYISKQCSEIVAPDYPLVLDMKSCSMEEYELARLTSLLARECGYVAGIQYEFCEAAGLYYHVGRLIGEPVIANGVLLAQKNSFPKEVIQILKEADGVDETISTPESAIVHIAAHISKVFLHLDPKKMKKKFDREFLINRELNELSQSGIYDQSGLGMNVFLKVRNYLSKGEWFYDYISTK